MDHFWWALIGGAVIIALLVWLFVYLGKREKAIAFDEMEEAALQMGDESLSMLLQQCQNEEEREIVYNFAKEQMQKEARLEREKKEHENDVIKSAEANDHLENGENEKAYIMSDDEEPVLPEASSLANDLEAFAAEAIMENEEEFTRIVDKNSSI